MLLNDEDDQSQDRLWEERNREMSKQNTSDNRKENESQEVRDMRKKKPMPDDIQTQEVPVSHRRVTISER